MTLEIRQDEESECGLHGTKQNVAVHVLRRFHAGLAKRLPFRARVTFRYTKNTSTKTQLLTTVLGCVYLGGVSVSCLRDVSAMLLRK